MWSRLARVGLGLGLVLEVLFASSGCAGRASAPAEAKAPAEAATPVEVAPVARGSLATAATYSGNVQARSRAQVLPKVAGRIDKLHVDVGSAVKAGDVIAEIDDRVLKAQVAQAEAALALANARLATVEEGPRAEQVAMAEANLRAAQERLAGLQNAAREEQVALAEANLKAAEARLEDIKNGARPEQIAAAEAQVRMAKNQLYATQSQGDLYLSGGNWIGGQQKVPYSKDLKEAQSGIAYEQVQAAEAQLANLKAGATQAQIEQAEAAVEAARQQLALAQKPVTEHDLGQAQAAADAARQQLALAQKPYTEHDLEAARAGVAQAKAAVDLARLQADEAVVTAPFDGVIVQRFLSQGALAAPTTPIVSLVSAEVEIAVDVEEGRLGQVQAGQPATITVAAFPGEEFAAAVSVVVPALDPRSRTASARIRPTGPNAGKLVDGMFAQVALGGASETQALLVPARAVVQTEGKAAVFAVRDGKAVRVPVTVGSGDGQSVAVLGELTDGDRVVVSGQENLRDGQAVVAGGAAP